MANQAFTLLGSSSRINSIGDGTPLAAAAARVWDEARDETLVAHPWNEALHRAALPVSADHVPANEYAYAYELPADCLRWLPWRQDHANWFEGVQEGRFILSNAEAPIYVRYIRRIEDVALWSVPLRAAIVAKLAWYLADSVTASSRKVDAAAAAFGEAIREAKKLDGLASGDRDRRAEYRSSWLDARSRGHG
jgi:hypothetical protein